MDETKALADELGVEKGNQDSLTALERNLKPIERFAVKFVEQVHPCQACLFLKWTMRPGLSMARHPKSIDILSGVRALGQSYSNNLYLVITISSYGMSVIVQVRFEGGLYDVDANAAIAQQQVDTQEWNMQEIERQKRLQVDVAHFSALKIPKGLSLSLCYIVKSPICSSTRLGQLIQKSASHTYLLYSAHVCYPSLPLDSDVPSKDCSFGIVRKSMTTSLLQTNALNL